MTDGTGDRKSHVLLIEDNPGDVELFRWALRHADLECELTVIDDGRDALDFARQTGKHAGGPVPDLAVLDLNLPKNDGIEVLEAMRSNDVMVGVPVIILSSSSWSRERSRLERFNIQRYITKPPSLDDFLQIGFTVRELLSDRRSIGTVPGA